jgi:cell division septation protein DedD
MEQRRVLLIIVSITIVLAAIVGVGIWLFYPRDAAEPDLVADAEGALEWEPIDYLRGDDELPGLDDDEEDGDFVVTYGVVEEEPERPAERASNAERASDAGDSDDRTPDDDFVTEAPAVVAVPEAEPTSTVERDDAAGRSAVAQPSVDPAPTTRSPEAAAPAVARAGTTPPQRDAAPTPSEELADRAYWVQVISSPNRDTVEGARRTLLEHQLGSRILTKEIGGTTYFRLRLGPFAAREEAEKFLDWVADIDGFADSMIFVDYTTAVLAAAPR